MNRGELVNAVAEATLLSRAQVETTVGAVLEQIMTATAAGEKVTLTGFGTFEARARSAREGRNPATGEPLQIAATRGAGFKAGTTFKQKVAATAAAPKKKAAAAKKTTPAAKEAASPVKKASAAKKSATAAATKAART